MRTPRPVGSILSAVIFFGAPILSTVVLAAFLAACSGRATGPEPPATGGASTGGGTSRGDVAAVAPTAAAALKFADVPGIRAELQARRGRPVLLNFWATWCGPCVEELPALGKFAREAGEGGPDLLGVSLDEWVYGDGRETEDKVRKALADAGVPYSNLIYEGDQDPLASAFQIPAGIPYSILYDAAGHRVRAWAGTIEIPELRDALATLK
jgi:thiol-disulfide isomerase/thioredoxin